jgi:phage FluMu protein gp41
MNTIYKSVALFVLLLIAPNVYSQNADPGIGILMSPASLTLGTTGILSANVGNYGNSTIVANSLRVTISVGTDAEIIGIAPGSDSRWTLLSMTTGSGNTIRLKNTAGGFSSFDVGNILLTIRGNVISGPDLILGNIVYITAANPLLCGVCPPTPLNVSQGNASTTNDNSQTSLAVTFPIIDAVVDTTSPINGYTGGTTTTLTANDTLNGLPVVIGTAPGNVTLTAVSVPSGLILNPNGTVSIAPNTPAGTYSVQYTICEVTNPTNCDTVTSSILVSAPVIDAVADAPSIVSGGTTPTVITNDTLNGVGPVVIGTAHGNVTLTSTPNGPLTMNPNGTITVAPNTPVGTYPITYTICEVTNPTNCDSVTVNVTVTAPVIDAVIDNPSVVSGGTTPTVITNDTLNGVGPVVIGTAPGNVTLSSTPNGPLTMNPNGTITVAPNTPIGTYPITYTICEVVNPTNCDTVTNNVTVTAPVIDAVVDTPSIVSGGTTPSVINNDTLNGVGPVVIGTAPGDVTLSSTPNGPLTMNPNGTITVAPNTPVGTYPITYTICEVVNPSNCDSVTVTVTVTAPIIDAVVDTTSPINGYTGGTTTTLTANDTLNGLPVVIGTAPGNVTLTAVNVPSGLTLNPNGTVTIAPNTPAGTYSVQYTICEVTNPTNCDTVTSSILVAAPVIDAVTDTPSIVSGGTTPTVITNDTLNGVGPVVIGTAPGNVTLTSTPNGPLSMNPNGTITVAPNTPVGTYPITYMICEVTNPTNCDSVTVNVTVTAPVIDAVVDTTSPVNGTVGGTTSPLTTNDTLNGVPVVIGTAPGNVTLTAVSVPTGLTLNPNGTVTIAPNTAPGSYSVQYTICEVTNPTNCDTVTSSIVVISNDFTPTIDIDNVVFLTAGVSRDFVVNISEIGAGPSVGQLVFKLPKQSGFTITYNATTTTSDVSGGTDVNNADWIITENSLFITVTLKPNKVIDINSFSSIGFSISRKINVPNQTWQPLTATIINGSGGDSDSSNNSYNVIVKAQ